MASRREVGNESKTRDEACRKRAVEMSEAGRKERQKNEKKKNEWELCVDESVSVTFNLCWWSIEFEKNWLSWLQIELLEIHGNLGEHYREHYYEHLRLWSFKFWTD